MTIGLSIAKTCTIITKKKRFATPIVARIFHRYSHPRKSMTYEYNKSDAIEIDCKVMPLRGYCSLHFHFSILSHCPKYLLNLRKKRVIASKDIGGSHTILYKGFRHISNYFIYNFQARTMTRNKAFRLQSL